MSIVLAHGILGFRRLACVEYFQGVKQHSVGSTQSYLWPADHAEEVGHDLNHFGGPGSFDHLQHYEDLVQRLQNVTKPGMVPIT